MVIAKALKAKDVRVGDRVLVWSDADQPLWATVITVAPDTWADKYYTFTFPAGVSSELKANERVMVIRK